MNTPEILTMQRIFICPCIADALGKSASAMYCESIKHMRFYCEHGEGIVITQLEPKRLGETSGIYFEAIVKASNSTPDCIQFIARELQLTRSYESGWTRNPNTGPWHMQIIEGALADIPDDAYS